MPTTPFTKSPNYLHFCDNGPITGQYVILHSSDEKDDFLQVSEVYVWDAPQPEDQSLLHSEFHAISVVKQTTLGLDFAFPSSVFLSNDGMSFTSITHPTTPRSLTQCSASI